MLNFVCVFVVFKDCYVYEYKFIFICYLFGYSWFKVF